VHSGAIIQGAKSGVALNTVNISINDIFNVTNTTDPI